MENGWVGSVKKAIAIDSQLVCFVYPTGEIVINSPQFVPPDLNTAQKSADKAIQL